MTRRRRCLVGTVRLALEQEGLLVKHRQRGCGQRRQRGGISPFAAMALAPLATQLAPPLVQQLTTGPFGGG